MPTPTDCRRCGRPYYGAAGLLCDECEREAKRPLDAPICSASWIERNDEMPERGQRVIAFSPVYPKGHEMRFRILDGQFIRITTEVEYWAYCEPMADSLPNSGITGAIASGASESSNEEKP